jgi:WD40 repeat protein
VSRRDAGTDSAPGEGPVTNLPEDAALPPHYVHPRANTSVVRVNRNATELGSRRAPRILSRSPAPEARHNDATSSTPSSLRGRVVKTVTVVFKEEARLASMPARSSESPGRDAGFVKRGGIRKLGFVTAGVGAAYLPPAGERIVTASNDTIARVWRADGTGAPWLLRGHEDVVTSGEFSPDGESIVTASMDRTARVCRGHAPARVSKSGNTRIAGST